MMDIYAGTLGIVSFAEHLHRVILSQVINLLDGAIVLLVLLNKFSY